MLNTIYKNCIVNSINDAVQSHVLFGILCIHLGTCVLFKRTFTKYK